MKDDPQERNKLLLRVQVQQEYNRRELWARIGQRVASFDEGCLLWLTQAHCDRG